MLLSNSTEVLMNTICMNAVHEVCAEQRHVSHNVRQLWCSLLSSWSKPTTASFSVIQTLQQYHSKILKSTMHIKNWIW